MIEELDVISQELEKKNTEITQINIKQNAIDKKIRELDEELNEIKIEKDRISNESQKTCRALSEGTFTNKDTDHLTASAKKNVERYEDIKKMRLAADEEKKNLYHHWNEVMKEFEILKQRILKTN